MDLLFEQNITHNSALSSHLISTTVREYYEKQERKSGLEFPLIFLVLPLVFHKQTADSISAKRLPGILYKALSENREIPLGLQDRIEGLSDLTLKSLNLSISTDLIYFDVNGSIELIPGEDSKIKFTNPQIKTAVIAAKKIGQSLAELNLEQICTYLNIRF